MIQFSYLYALRDSGVILQSEMSSNGRREDDEPSSELETALIRLEEEQQRSDSNITHRHTLTHSHIVN